MERSGERFWSEVLVRSLVWTFTVPTEWNCYNNKNRYRNNISVYTAGKVKYRLTNEGKVNYSLTNDITASDSGDNTRVETSDYNQSTQEHLIINQENTYRNTRIIIRGSVDDLNPPAVGQKNQGENDKEGISNKRQGIHDRKQGIPDKRQRIPERRLGIPDRRQGIPDRRQGIPDRRQGIPNKSEGIPNIRQTIQEYNWINEGLHDSDDKLLPLGRHKTINHRRRILLNARRPPVNQTVVLHSDCEGNIHKNTSYHSTNKYHSTIIEQEEAEEFTISDNGTHKVSVGEYPLIEDCTCPNRLQQHGDLIKTDLNVCQVNSEIPQTASLACQQCVTMNDHRNNHHCVSGSCVTETKKTTDTQRCNVNQSEKKKPALRILKRYTRPGMGNEPQQVKPWTKRDRICKKTERRMRPLNLLQKTKIPAVFKRQEVKDRNSECKDRTPHEDKMSAHTGTYSVIPGSRVPLRKWLEPRDDCDRMTVKTLTPQNCDASLTSNHNSSNNSGNFTAEICDKLDSLLGKESHNNNGYSDLCDFGDRSVNVPDCSVDLSGGKQAPVVVRSDRDHYGSVNIKGVPIIDVTLSDINNKSDNKHQLRISPSDETLSAHQRIMREGGEDNRYLRVPDPWEGADPKLMMGVCEDKEGMDAVKAVTARLKVIN